MARTKREDLPASVACSKCHKTKRATTEFFNANRTKPNGLDDYCIPCRKKYRNDRAKAAREKEATEKKPLSADEVVRGTDEVPEVSKKWFLREAYAMYRQQVKDKNTTNALRCLEMIARVGNLGREKELSEKEMIIALMESARRGDLIRPPVPPLEERSVSDESTESPGGA